LPSTILQLIIAIYNFHHKTFSYCQQSGSLRHEIIAIAISEWVYTAATSSLMSLSVAETSMLISAAVISISELTSIRKFFKTVELNLSAESTTCF
jgi:hypothetical protein